MAYRSALVFAVALLAAVLATVPVGFAQAPGTDADTNTNTNTSFADRLVAAGLARVGRTTRYDAAYQKLAFPGGDVADDRGVCSDVIIRAYRAIGIDLQALVHQDMRRAFSVYPKRWRLTRPDPNIDHRRVPNLRRFFSRHGTSLPVSLDGRDYTPGELVTWDITRPLGATRPGPPSAGGGLAFARKPHIGIVTDRRSSDGRRPLIVHNIGLGAQVDDILFAFEVTGRYRYEPHSTAR